MERFNLNERQKLVPSNKESSISGGTSDILPEERKTASFKVEEMTEFLNGGKEGIKRKKFIESVVSKNPEDSIKEYNYTREEYLSEGVKNFIGYHKPYANFKPTRADVAHMAEIGIAYGALNNSQGIFISTLVGQGSAEQSAFWVPKVLRFEIAGSYAQTELGHGSNVRGLQTTAVYDQETDEFVLNTPTLTSMKWWPGCLGKICTHCTLYAQLIIKGKEYGVNVFMVQLRDENHMPLNGVRLGDLGNKIGDNGNDTGYLILENIRIPRENMLCKYRRVTREGVFEEVGKVDPKVHYTTMMATRAMMVNTAGARLCQASTIAIRYSAVRKQGFLDTKASVSYQTPERKIIDYRIQQYRLFKWLSYSYAIKFAGRWMLKELDTIEGGVYGQIKNTEGLKEIASTSAGLKSLTSWTATIGVEDLRKSCGGNGYLMHSGIASHGCDYLWQPTAEGDFVILGLLTARFLYNSIGEVLKGKNVSNVVEYLNILQNSDISKMHPGDVTSESNLYNLKYLVSLFQFRSIYKNLNAYTEIQELLKKRNSFESAWMQLGNELLQGSFAHCYYIILKNFVNKINECENKQLKTVLTRLCCLFAFTNILDDNWGEIISRDQYKLFRSAAYQMMGEIRPDAVALVDSFDYPDYILKSSIGSYDGNVYEALFENAQNSILNKNEICDAYSNLAPHTNKVLLAHGNKALQKGKF